MAPVATEFEKNHQYRYALFARRRARALAPALAESRLSITTRLSFASAKAKTLISCIARERKKNEALADKIFSRGRRQSAPTNSKPQIGASLASRVGVKKVLNIQSTSNPSLAALLMLTNQIVPAPEQSRHRAFIPTP
ncbi:uncharacterized protein TrAtP1_010060 [Trichoderma atroviride]|uniref:uncharacterized protein n=1 Tax=Hypocrea atroviridis TaxID=63577 RepID=UPI00332F1A88|nr:hypothetical protein TrAtP1_010060 [Trichoderma atroviride]